MEKKKKKRKKKRRRKKKRKRRRRRKKKKMWRMKKKKRRKKNRRRKKRRKKKKKNKKNGRWRKKEKRKRRGGGGRRRISLATSTQFLPAQTRLSAGSVLQTAPTIQLVCHVTIITFLVCLLMPFPRPPRLPRTYDFFSPHFAPVYILSYIKILPKFSSHLVFT